VQPLGDTLVVFCILLWLIAAAVAAIRIGYFGDIFAVRRSV
jgi:hypothetical protein